MLSEQTEAGGLVQYIKIENDFGRNLVLAALFRLTKTFEWFY